MVKQGMSYPNPRNHPALRRILGEEVPHLFPPPPRSVSGVGGWGKVLKKEKAAKTGDETGRATGADASPMSVMNIMAGRKRPRLEA